MQRFVRHPGGRPGHGLPPGGPYLRGRDRASAYPIWRRRLPHRHPPVPPDVRQPLGLPPRNTPGRVPLPAGREHFGQAVCAWCTPYCTVYAKKGKNLKLDNIKSLFLKVMLGCLIAAAALAVVTILVGHFNDLAG